LTGRVRRTPQYGNEFKNALIAPHEEKKKKKKNTRFASREKKKDLAGGQVDRERNQVSRQENTLFWLRGARKEVALQTEPKEEQHHVGVVTTGQKVPSRGEKEAHGGITVNAERKGRTVSTKSLGIGGRGF